ncbi:MAG: hypothetical protein OEY23_02625 [Acidimicrobiia bacterium]|nr:hypothetical protein [Acidimicrobiia bacterium]
MSPPTNGPAGDLDADGLGDLRPFGERLAELLVAVGSRPGPEELAEAALRLRIGDGLPLVAPTAARLDAMLEGRNPLAPAPVGPLPMSFAVPSWEDLAAAAVLAGCAPGVLAVMAAALDAMSDPGFNLLGVQSTTGAAAPLTVLAGPVVEQLGLNAGANALGSGWRANATIGRAIRLVLQNVGLAYPGEGDMATHGHPGKYGWLVAENAPASVWPTLASDRGLDPNASAVTVFPGVGNVEVVLPVDSAEHLATVLARVLAALRAPTTLLLLPPESTRLCARDGWGRPELARALVAAGAPDGEIVTVVTGGAGIKSTVVPGWGGPCGPVTREIRGEP